MRKNTEDLLKKQIISSLCLVVFLAILLSGGTGGCSKAPEEQPGDVLVSEGPPPPNPLNPPGTGSGTETGNPSSPSPSTQGTSGSGGSGGGPAGGVGGSAPGGMGGTAGAGGSAEVGGSGGVAGVAGSGAAGAGGFGGSAGSSTGGSAGGGTSGSGGFSGHGGHSGSAGSAGSAGSGGPAGSGGSAGTGGSGGNNLPNTAGIDFTLFPPTPNPSFPIPQTAKVITVNTATAADPSPCPTRATLAQTPFKTINAAVACALAGDKIVISSGTYLEGDSNTGKGLPVNKANLILTNAPGSSVMIRPLNNNYTYGVNITGDGVILNGLTIQNFSTVGIELGGDGTTLTNITLSNINVQAVTEGIINYEDFGSPYSSPTINGLRLENVTITNALTQGFSCNAGPCKNVYFKGVIVTNRSTPAGNSGSDCIAFERGDNLVFNNVESTGCEADGLDLKATRVLVINSNFHNISRNGLKLWKGGDVQNTIVSNTGADGEVIFDGPGAYRMINSIVAYHLNGQPGSYTITTDYDTRCGTQLSVSQNPSRAANYCCSTVYANTCGSLTLELTNNVFLSDSGPIFVPTAVGVILRNNIFAAFAEDSDGNGFGDFLEIRDQNFARFDQPNQFGSGNFRYNANPPPIFINAGVNVTNKNWRSVPGGPLINAGTVPNPSTFPLVDFYELPRILGGTVDIGPIENQ